MLEKAFDKFKNTNGIITQAFFMIDSHSYIKSDFWGLLGNYDNIHDNQVEWYEKEIKRINSENNKTIKAIQGDVNGGLHCN